ncbi:ImmA/IrrE family metallo-endopeptidase [Tissierella praeacuta]|uniref:ImmA/IrrE family metallo-endopeptidase n=1 Tax=Tissierella praeacuta TaxID=43131 RepID=UPI003DA48314
MEKWVSKYILYEMIHNFMLDNPDFIYTDIKSFCKSKNWNIIDYNNSNKELLQISADGYTFYENNQFSIFYNMDKPKARQRFTITHEIGHIILYHHLYVPSNILMNSNSKGIWECQADTFAQNVLFPTELAENLKGQSVNSIAKYLGVSREMVNIRYKNLREDLYWFNEVQNSI